MPDQSPTSCPARLRSIADPTRLAVMRLLAKEALHVGELCERLNIEQSHLSHHLRVLREHGMVETERDGKSVLYRVPASMRQDARGEAIDLGCCRLTF